MWPYSQSSVILFACMSNFGQAVVEFFDYLLLDKEEITQDNMSSFIIKFINYIGALNTWFRFTLELLMMKANHGIYRFKKIRCDH